MSTTIENITIHTGEIFKDIPDYDGLYKISNKGRVLSLWDEKPKILKQSINANGYKVLNLCYHVQKMHYIHHLVAYVFLGYKTNKNNKFVVDHIDNNKSNNDISNLQIISIRENCSKDKVGITSTFTGVSKVNNRYYVAIKINGKSKYIGSFKNEIEAHKHYEKAVHAINNGEDIEVKKAVYASKYKGVYWRADRLQWAAYKNVGGKRKYLGQFHSEEDAYSAILKYNN